MSGGSWDYLFAKQDAEIFGDVDTLRAARDRLVELGISGNIIFDLNRIISHLDEARRLGESRQLRDVLYEMEWHDSADHSIHVLRHAVWQYNGARPCDHANCDEPQWSYCGWQDDDGVWCSGDVFQKHCLDCGSDVVIERKNVKRNT